MEDEKDLYQMKYVLITFLNPINYSLQNCSGDIVIKDFEAWNIQKQKANNYQVRASFKEREVWWCSLGANIGDEQDGKGNNFTRPVLVFKKFNKHIFLGIPLSTQIKDKPYYCKIHFKGIEQSFILSQIRLMDAKRFKDKMGELPMSDFNIIKDNLTRLIF